MESVLTKHVACAVAVIAIISTRFLWQTIGAQHGRVLLLALQSQESLQTQSMLGVLSSPAQPAMSSAQVGGIT